VYFCVLNGFQNKWRFFPCTALIGWFSYPRRCVFTARYELKSRLILYFIRAKGYSHVYKYLNCWLPSNCIRRTCQDDCRQERKKRESHTLSDYTSTVLTCTVLLGPYVRRHGEIIWHTSRQKIISVLGSWCICVVNIYMKEKFCL
jgi:hypothetical protein